MSNQTEESRSATHTQQLQLSLKRNISSLLSNSVHSSGCMVMTTAFQFKQFATAILYVTFDQQLHVLQLDVEFMNWLLFFSNSIHYLQ